jgi:hypothetical protein
MYVHAHVQHTRANGAQCRYCTYIQNTVCTHSYDGLRISWADRAHHCYVHVHSIESRETLGSGRGRGKGRGGGGEGEQQFHEPGPVTLLRPDETRRDMTSALRGAAKRADDFHVKIAARRVGRGRVITRNGIRCAGSSQNGTNAASGSVSGSAGPALAALWAPCTCQALLAVIIADGLG